MNNATTLSATDLDTLATILVSALAHHGTGNAAWWTARATESYPMHSTPEAFIPHVLKAASAAGRLMTPGPQAVCWESMAGALSVRLSSSVLCF